MIWDKKNHTQIQKIVLYYCCSIFFLSPEQELQVLLHHCSVEKSKKYKIDTILPFVLHFFFSDNWRVMKITIFKQKGCMQGPWGSQYSKAKKKKNVHVNGKIIGTFGISNMKWNKKGVNCCTCILCVSILNNKNGNVRPCNFGWGTPIYFLLFKWQY